MLGVSILWGVLGLKKSRKQVNGCVDSLLDITNTLALLKPNCKGANIERARTVTTGVNQALTLAGCVADSSDEDV